MSSESMDVSRVLADLRAGDRSAFDRLIPLIYDELRRLARHVLAGRPRGATLQTTALVHEAVLRFVHRDDLGWENRAHLFGAAAKAMRCVLVDHARARMAAKRGGGEAHVYLDEALAVFEERNLDVLALDQALERLAAFDPRKAQMVELRFFGGLTNAQTAQVLGISEPTVERDWQLARAWLRKELAA